MGVAVAIVDPFAPEVLDVFRVALPQSWTLYVGDGRNGSDAASALRMADVAFVMAAPLPAELLSGASRLGLIQKLGAGVDRIDLDWCKTNGVGVARLFAGNAIPVAEHTVMLMLAVYRRLPLLDRNVRDGKWQKEESRSVNRHLFGKTIGIVGLGAIGHAVAEVLSGFGVTVLYYDPIAASADLEDRLRLTRVDLETLLRRSDIVTLHLPLTKESTHLIDAKRIASMKRGAVIINCARGGLIDEAALVDALRSGQISGAGLDAFALEPPTGSAILGLPNVVVTPHCAGATIDNVASIAARAVENATLFAAGSPLPASDVVVQPGRRFHG